jgi:hypothetical protein
MSTIIRILIGIGLFTFGYHLGREVGRMEPIRDELSRMRGRKGFTIEAEPSDPEARKTSD